MVDKSILKELADTLNEHNLTWGIGGSYLLKLYDLIDNPNDLDLWVIQDNIVELRRIFSNYTEIKTNIPLPSHLHYKIMYKGLEVDFVACFMIKPNQYAFEYNISPSNIKTINLSNDVELPCTYLEDWYVVYKLLKREEKAQLIKDFFEKNKLTLSEKAIRESLNISILPKYISHDVYKLVDDIMQISFFD